MSDLVLTAQKMGYVMQIPTELLADSAVELRVITDDEWRIRTEAAQALRRYMDSDGATPGQKRSQTWKIKRMLRGNPRMEFVTHG